MPVKNEVIHKGKSHDRTKLEPDHRINEERVFSEEWEKLQDPPLFLNRGVGTLRWLLCAEVRPSWSGGEDWDIVRDLTQEEATTAATVAQWLGTSVGFGFLEETLMKCGYRIVPDEKLRAAALKARETEGAK